MLLGAAGTAAYATARTWPISVPLAVWVGGVLVAMPVGMLAGLYPAVRAARMTPVTALATP